VTSRIREVTLYEQVKAGALILPPETANPAAVSKHFKPIPGADGLSFKVRATDEAFGRLIPGVKRNFSVRIELENGQVLDSWTINASTGRVTDKPLAITPAQAAAKGLANKKEISVYKVVPKSGEDVRLSLTAPPNAVLNHVSIAGADAKKTANEKLGFAEGGFELVRSGENDWTIRFKDGELPVVTAAKPFNFKKSYTLKVELWPDGAYQVKADGTADLDAAGRPKPLMNGNKIASKPVVVNVKVNVKP